MGCIQYYFSKLIKKLPGASIKNSTFEQPSKCEARSLVVNSSFGKYSYCGYNCTILNSSIGRFVSIADGVSIGLNNHPQTWVSTSPAFYYGKDSIPKNLACLEFTPACKDTNVGNDVWIGKNAIIIAGVSIGDGAIIGAGAIVTGDVEPYSIVAGVPAKKIRMRFDPETIRKLLQSKWWHYSDEQLKSVSETMNDVDAFLRAIEEKGYCGGTK